MRILYYARRNLHPPHFEPIRLWFVKNHPQVEMIYSSPPYTPSIEGMPGIGLSPDDIQKLESNGVGWIPQDQIRSWNPDITVVADADFGGIDWGGRIVNVNHGLICKGTFYTTSPVAQRENGADLICVPGIYHANILKKSVHRPIAPTGLVKFDDVGNGTLTQSSARKQFGIPEDVKAVLFSPTYNMELSAVPVVTDQVRKIVADGTWLIIKLHGMSPPAWFEMYHWLSHLDERIVFVEGSDLTPAIMAADVVISDVSSAFMEAMALDRPVILVNNPFQRHFHSYDPNDIEYAWRDVGVEVATPAQMIDAVRYALKNPQHKADKRAFYGPQLVGPIDGKASERTGEAMLAMMR